MAEGEKVTITMSAKALQTIVSYMQLSEEFHNAKMDKEEKHVYNELARVLQGTRFWQEENARWKGYLANKNMIKNSNVIPFTKSIK